MENESWYACPHDDKAYEDMKAALKKAQPDIYSMSFLRPSEDYELIAAVFSEGIDSHLEAITERTTVTDDRGSLFPRAQFMVHPDELPVIIRRLFGMDTEASIDLATSILESIFSESY